MNNEFPPPSEDAITDRNKMNRRKQEAESSFAAPAGSAALYATKSQIAAAAARTAAEWIDREMWVEAYMELHQAARICWERRNEERKHSNND